MKLYILFTTFICCLNFSFSQTKDSLTIKEQHRRENNIQAGNPFKEFRYKPKIATLSNGKYLEFHDRDSIVNIGSFAYNIKNKSITGYIKVEEKNSEATLSPEIISRWMSPDPLAEEFPSWSPYNFVMNNPIYLIDPDGRKVTKWFNENGDLVYDDEKGEYTSAASAEDKLYGEKLRTSGKVGEAQFNLLVSDPQKTTVIFSEDEGPVRAFGKVTNVKFNKDGSVKSSTLTVYKGTSEKAMENPKEYGEYLDTEEIKYIKEGNLNVDDLIAAVFGHEIAHTTKKNQEMQNDKDPRHETIPQTIDKAILEDLSDKNKVKKDND